MLTTNKKGHPILRTEASLNYSLATGPAWYRFYEEFKQEKIFGVKCPKCGRILVPARSFCSRCFEDTTEWVEVADEGELIAWSRTDFEYFGMPVEPPFVTGLIKLDGTDTPIMHRVAGFNLKDLDLVQKTLTQKRRVKAFWKKEKRGCILDIEYFKPI